MKIVRIYLSRAPRRAGINYHIQFGLARLQTTYFPRSNSYRNPSLARRSLFVILLVWFKILIRRHKRKMVFSSSGMYKTRIQYSMCAFGVLSMTNSVQMLTKSSVHNKTAFQYYVRVAG